MMRKVEKGRDNLRRQEDDEKGRDSLRRQEDEKGRDSLHNEVEHGG